MDTEFERLVSVLIEGNHCYECGTPLLIDPTDLNAEGDGLYTSEYSCPGCVAEFAISIEDHEALLRMEYTRIDEEAPEELLTPFQSQRKEALRRQAHPVKSLVEGYIELNAGLTLMWENKRRIIEACDFLREEGVHNHGEEFQRTVHADIHNYVASAYTFDEILKNVKPNLPIGGPVEKAIESYKDEKRVITGLRVYAQHQFTIPISFSIIAGENAGEYDRTITVKLEDVKSIETDISNHPPDGYHYGAEHHYEKVDGEYINFERRVNLHYGAAEELVGAIAEHAENVRGDEIKEFREGTTYTSNL